MYNKLLWTFEREMTRLRMWLRVAKKFGDEIQTDLWENLRLKGLQGTLCYNHQEMF